jgi:hypothetical protein
LCASGWRSTRPFRNKSVVSRATNEPLRYNWQDAARGVERLVDSDVPVQDGVREHPFVLRGEYRLAW